jgi:SAM-dependent methyltransferase
MIGEVLWLGWHTGAALYRRQRQLHRDLPAWHKFWVSYHRYRKLAPRAFRPSALDLQPCLGDDTAETAIEPTYFYQDAWAFERIVQQHPACHVDVGSHHKYVALLSKVLPVTMVDIRPLSLPLETLHFREGSILAMPFEDDSVCSLSSLCVVEHIGLGRYGDPLDWQGTEKAIAELKRVLALGGDLYLSVPIDDGNRVFFNAHRAFSEPYFESLLHPLEIRDRRYIHGKQFGMERQSGFCIGCYHLRKPDTLQHEAGDR